MSRRFLSGSKGIFFSLFAVILLLLIALQFVGQQKFEIESQSEALQTRFQISNGLLKDVEKIMLPQLLESDVAIALDAIALNVSADKADPAFLPDMESLVSAVNDTVMGRQLTFAVGNATLPAQLPALQQFAQQQFHIDLYIKPLTIVIFQDATTGPEYVGVTMNATLIANVSNFAHWEKFLENVRATVPIRGLRDPYLLVHAQPVDSISFERPAPWLAYPDRNINQFKSFVYKGSYTNDSQAPDYLQRFINDMSKSSCCGIETFVAGNVNMQKGDVKPQDMVDWCYWSDRCSGNNIFNITDVTAYSDWQQFYEFRIDAGHAGKFGLQTDKPCYCEFVSETESKWSTGCGHFTGTSC